MSHCQGFEIFRLSFCDECTVLTVAFVAGLKMYWRPRFSPPEVSGNHPDTVLLFRRNRVLGHFVP